MELFKLLLLIACSAILIFLVLPAITIFFIFRAKEPQKFARRAKAGVIVGIVLAILLLGVIIWDTVDMLLPDDMPPVSTEPSIETTEATESFPTPTVPETTEATESLPLPTINNEELEGVWIAAAEPYIPEDENYMLMTEAGYYIFTADGNFTYTQLCMVKAGAWQQLEELFQCSGTYVLNGDLLALHYTMSSEESDAMQPVDYTEQVSMLVDRTCTEMCIRTPDHPKLGQLLFFRKGRADDPANSILILLNSQ